MSQSPTILAPLTGIENLLTIHMSDQCASRMARKMLYMHCATHNTINKEAVMTDYTDELLDVMYDDHDDDVDDAVEM